MRSAFFIFMLCFISSELFSQTNKLTISSLQEACDIALKNNPDQRSYQLNIDKAKTDFRSSQAYLLPSIAGSFGTQINTQLATTAIPGEIFGRPGQTINAQFGQKYNYNAGLTASKTLLDWQNFILMEIAKNGSKASELQADAFVQSLKQQVSLYYFSILVSQQALSAYRKDSVIADSTVLLSKQKLDKGLINAISANQSIINKNNILQQIMNTEIILNQCLNSLKILLGTDANTELQLMTKGVNEQDLIAVQNLGKDKNLAIVENQLRSSELKVNLQKSAFAPKLSISAFIGKQQYNKDFSTDFITNGWHPISYVALNLQVPIFTGFSNYTKLKSSKLEYQRLQNDWTENQRKSSMADQLLLYEFSQSKKLIQTSRENYQLFAQNQELANQQMKEGMISMDSYFKYQDDYLKAENAYLNSLSVAYNYFSTIYSRQ